MVLQIVKIHPSSSLVDKKVEAIIYDELVGCPPIMSAGRS